MAAVVVVALRSILAIVFTIRMGREAMTLGGDSSRKLRSLARQSESENED